MNLTSLFRPRATLSDEEVRHGLRMMTWEGVASQAMFSVTTSGILAAFALALGANNFQIGIMAAIPFITQPLQIPAILLVEKLRWRKAIALVSWVPAQLMWIPMALIPFFVGIPSATAVALLLAFLAFRGALASVTGCAWNSWIRDLVPQNILGSFFSRRLALATVASIIFGLAGAFFIDYWQGRASPETQVFGYTFVLLAGVIFLGMATPLFMSQMPEPLMPRLSGPQPSLVRALATPFKDLNFRQLLNFLFFWSFAANLAIPFFTIYMLQRLGFSLTTVIALNTLAQITNVMFLRVWGPFADRFGSKVVLSIAVSLYLMVILGWAFTTQPDRYVLTVPLVIILQIFAGVAAAGVTLTVGTIGLKLAPQGEATSYMAAASLATNLGTGLGPLAGGLFADFFDVRKLSVNFEWIDPSRTISFPAIDLTGFDFLFTLAFIIGFITLNALTTIREEGEVEREIVMQELMASSRGMTRILGSIPGVRLLGEYPYAFLRRVPGIDVALGVTAYQFASSVKAALSVTSQGRRTAETIAQQVGGVVAQAMEQAGELRGVGREVARQAARGAVNAVDEVAGGVNELARGAVVGALGALAKTRVEPGDAVWGAGYGAVQGAGEAGADIGVVAVEAVQGAREAASELGMSEEDAAVQAALGALAAAESISHDAGVLVTQALAEAGLPAAALADGDRRTGHGQSSD